MIFPNLLRYKKIISICLIFYGLFYILIQLSIHRQSFTENYNPALSQKKYENSQWSISTNIAASKALGAWALKNGFSGWESVKFDNRQTTINPSSLKQTLLDAVESRKISDAELYAYAGYRYVHGQNPIYLNAEVPPFGKYLIGISILLFNNASLFSIIFALLCLPIIFNITKLISHSTLAAALAVFLTSIHSLFIDQMISSPQLDIFQLFFFLLFIYFFIHLEKKQRTTTLIALGIVFGVFLSIKLSVVSFFIINSFLVLYFIFKKESLRNVLIKMLTINSIGVIVYLLTYSAYFLQSGSLHGFLSAQKWIVHYYLDSHINLLKLLGSYIPLILLNKWKFWSDGYPIISYNHWNLLWPTLYILGIVSIVSIVRNIRKYDPRVKILLAFFLTYSSILAVITIYPRYLLLLFVPLHILIAVRFATIIRE